MLCRGWAWLSCRLELPPLTHPQHQLQYSLPTARLFRLPDVVRGLSASATTCDSLVLCYCVCCLADPVSPRPPQWSTHLQIPALLPPCHPASLLPAYSPPWVLGVNLSTAQADATVSFCRLQFHLPEPDAEPLSPFPTRRSSDLRLPLGLTNTLVQTATEGKTETERARQRTADGLQVNYAFLLCIIPWTWGPVSLGCSAHGPL